MTPSRSPRLFLVLRVHELPQEPQTARQEGPLSLDCRGCRSTRTSRQLFDWFFGWYNPIHGDGKLITYSFSKEYPRASWYPRTWALTRLSKTTKVARSAREKIMMDFSTTECYTESIIKTEGQAWEKAVERFNGRAETNTFCIIATQGISMISMTTIRNGGIPPCSIPNWFQSH